ncbi:MAG: hypothetical protein F4X36_20025 [Gammaproteobacteria bacterium]|nr:hypothetical protein [Gammaproteobacteria bacterium]
MDIDAAIAVTQERLADEGASMGELLGHLRSGISPVLIGEPQWARILERAGTLPITMGAQPFGFELPLHERRPEADFGVSLSSGNRSGAFFEARARNDATDETARAVSRLFREMEAEHSPLREIVGRKLMLEYDIGSVGGSAGDTDAMPGMFLRPNERTILSGGGHRQDVGIVVDALISCVGWERIAAERENVERVYLAQPEDTRLDSFGVFPSRARTVRLAVMGFQGRRAIRSFLEEIGWPGETDAVAAVVSRFEERASIVRSGANVDVREDGVGPTLGLTLIVRQRYTGDSRYWLDGLTDWDPFLAALGHEELVVPEKLTALAGWASKPSTLFGKTGRFVMLRGIHHIKLVISGSRLEKAKAYVYMVLSGALPG